MHATFSRLLMSASSVAALRQLFPKYNIGHYIVLTQDAHDSEYVAEADQRRAFITGFTGSAGHACVGLETAELATDGRYFLQAENQLKKEFALRKMVPGVQDWISALAERANKDGKNIGVDPRLISASMAKSIQSQLTRCRLVGLDDNLIDAVWQGKPQEPNGLVTVAECPGEEVESKLERVRRVMKQKGAETLVVSALDDIAWLFNLRGSDIEYNPVFKAYALVGLKNVYLYVDQSKLAECQNRAPPAKDYNQIWADLKEARNVWVPAGSSWAIEQHTNEIVATETSPIKLFKVVKNKVELEGAKRAQLQCGLSITRLLAWLDRTLDTRQITEYQAAEKLLKLRQTLPGFRGNSFPTISSFGANAAIIHYAPQPESPNLDRSQVYLLDSGCQFYDGTTDTTRTHHFGSATSQEREAYTLVLKGHIALSELVFPQGTTGQQLDAFARQFLWKYGLDYRHGTGHGVGSYLNVHEPPVGFGTADWAKEPLQEGNLISNEPGYYEDGQFGIRIENLVIVTSAKTKHNFAKFLRLETITLVPLCRELIDPELLTGEERQWVNSYHARVRTSLESSLDDEDKQWLYRATEPLN